jgi:hypothetical protein
MALRELRDFLTSTLSAPRSPWSEAGIDDISGQRVPDIVFRSSRSLLWADIHQVWASWFVDSICDPDRLAEDYPGHAIVAGKIQRALDRLLPPSMPKAEKRKLLELMLLLTIDRVRARQFRRRAMQDFATKALLLEGAGRPPRCWVCGFPFADHAIDKFLSIDQRNFEMRLPEFLDFIQPRGRKIRDISIEIDHVDPFWAGGSEEDNLQLACGWCNSNKGWRISLYDASNEPIEFRHPRLGKVFAPQPFWVVRLLATKGRCENPGGCAKTTRNSSLRIQAEYADGALNPLNLRAVCDEHDEIGSNRFVHRSLFDRS